MRKILDINELIGYNKQKRGYKMKTVLKILCFVFAAICCVFPFVYTHGEADKKEVKISHILVNTEEEAIKVRQEIVDGKKFEDMVEQYSICESKAQKGSIGYNIRNGVLLKEFTDAAFKLNKFELSEPVKTSAGWHLIKIYDIKYFSDKDNFSRRYF